MTPAQTLAALIKVAAYKPDARDRVSLDQIKRGFTGSDGENARKALGINTVTPLAKIRALIVEWTAKAGQPVAVEPVTPAGVVCLTCGGSGRVSAPAEPTPPKHPTPPVSVPDPVPPVVVKPTEPTAFRNLYNEDKATLADGTAVTIQNSKRPGTTRWDGKDHFIFDLLDSTDQRPSEKKPAGTKRRSEVSSIKALAPKPGQVQVFSGEVFVHAQPFADNQQWVLAQRHGAPNTGHPEVAFRIGKGGFAILSTCSSTTVESIDITAKDAKGAKRLMPIGVWKKVAIKDFGGRVELWIDGELWVTSNNPANYPGEGTPYWKFGLYNSQGSNEHSTVEWRGVRLSYEAA